MKKVFLIHAWDSNSKECWYPWLKEQLEKKDFVVTVPDMPNTHHPKIHKWVQKIKELVGEPNENVYLIGHSIGCQAIMRYLESLPEGVKVGKVIFIAGWFDLLEEVYEDDYENDKKILEPWINTPIDFEKVKSHSDFFIAINSDNDPYVDLSELKIFEEKLNAKGIILNGKGHLSEEDTDIKEFPELLEEVLK